VRHARFNFRLAGENLLETWLKLAKSQHKAEFKQKFKGIMSMDFTKI
jgi:hypothetical protein